MLILKTFLLKELKYHIEKDYYYRLFLHFSRKIWMREFELEKRHKVILQPVVA